MATCAVPHPRIAARMQRSLQQHEDVFTYGASPANTGLAHVGEQEGANEALVLAAMAALESAPMFHAAVAALERGLFRSGFHTPGGPRLAAGKGDADEAGFHLRLFAARCYLAGSTLAGKVGA